MKPGTLSEEVRVGICCHRQVKTMCNLAGAQKGKSQMSCFSPTLSRPRSDPQGFCLLPAKRQHLKASARGERLGPGLTAPAVPVPVDDHADLTWATVLINTSFPPDRFLKHVRSVLKQPVSRAASVSGDLGLAAMAAGGC